MSFPGLVDIFSVLKAVIFFPVLDFVRLFQVFICIPAFPSIIIHIVHNVHK